MYFARLGSEKGALTMTATHDELVHQVVETYRSAFRALQATAPPDWMMVDLPFAQLRTLRTVAQLGTTSISRLGEALGVGQPAASYLVDRLVQAGLATRAEDPTDRRRTLVRLTAQGEEVACVFSYANHLQTVLAQLKEEDLLALRQGLQALAQAAAVLRETATAETEGA
jgi:DNA-binding MarR family transcriptional regulator